MTDLFRPTFGGAEVIRLADVHDDPRYGHGAPHHGMPAGLPVRSHLALPVRSRSGEVHGGLFFGHPEVGRFDQVDEELAVGIATHAALAIDSIRLYQRQRETALTLQHSLLPQEVPAIAGARAAFAYRPASSHAEVGGDWYDVSASPTAPLRSRSATSSATTCAPPR